METSIGIKAAIENVETELLELELLDFETKSKVTLFKIRLKNLQNDLKKVLKIESTII